MKIPNIETKSEYLHHYTDAYGLLGILENKEIWATDSRFLNDSKEIEAGIETYTKRLNTEIDKLKKSKNKYKEEIINFYEILIKTIRENLIQRNIYIASFTKHRDNLRQWMSYCPANAGYAIVFRTNQLFNQPPKEPDSQAKRLIDVNYKKTLNDLEFSPEKFTKKITDLINKKPALINYSLEMVNRLIFKCAAIKNEEFYDEDEVRLLILSGIKKNNDRNHRSRSGIILPYQKFQINKECISEIIIGPNVNIKLAEAGLKDLLHKNSYECKVTLSSCSLRVF